MENSNLQQAYEEPTDQNMSDLELDYNPGSVLFTDIARYYRICDPNEKTRINESLKQLVDDGIGKLRNEN